MRGELESYQRQIEAIPFDIPSDDTPYCLDWNKREYHVNLIEMLNPTLDSLFDMIDNYAKDHGCHEFLDFNSKLFQLKSEYAATGFRIGVLAGVDICRMPQGSNQIGSSGALKSRAAPPAPGCLKTTVYEQRSSTIHQ